MAKRSIVWFWAALPVLLSLLAGCAGLPDVSRRAESLILPPATHAALARLASASVPPGELSGLRLLSSATASLQARLALIERAQASVDLQYYQFKGDGTGRLLMRALRDAAARGVRVRLLLDDLYTAGDDGLWLGLAAHPNVEVRLFNPFMFGRQSLFTRLTATLFGDPRLHRRMHNKLFVADGVLAIVGGRNIADEYFLRDGQEGFFDFDVLIAGAVVDQLSRSFDPYWNSRFTHDARAVMGGQMPPHELRRAFDDAVRDVCAAPACASPPRPSPPDLDEWSDLPLALERGRLAMHWAPASAAADPPEKIELEPAADITALTAAGAEVRMRVASAIRQAREELVIVSPYLIPGSNGVEALRGFRQRGVRVTLLTNSLAATDEPLVHVGYRRYRAAILREGVELYEWSPARGGRVLRQLIGGDTVLRLHAKCAVIDRRLVYLGSMNFDPRSRDLNTEFGLLIESPAFADEIQAHIERMKREGSFRLEVAEDGQTLRWRAGDSNDDSGEFEPGADFWSRLLLDLLAPFVPEEML